MSDEAKPNILAAGVYLADVDNTAEHVRSILAATKSFNVVQRWTAIALTPNAKVLSPEDRVVTQRTARFKLINQMLQDYGAFDWIVVTDDDVELAPGFLDDLISVADMADFALFQPARTRDSFIDHLITAQCDGVTARRTNFVEIGPIVCLRVDAARLLMPFDETTEMAWGLDYIWPIIIAEAGLKMGIVDGAAAAHRIRMPNVTYSGDRARDEARLLLGRHRSVQKCDAFRVLDVIL
jgi:hypothetical protein